MQYCVFSQSVRGSSHIRKDLPREDFGFKLDEEEIKVFTVADGHGDSRCCRAHIGSELICRIATTELKEFALEIKRQSWERKLFEDDDCRKLVLTLVTSIIGKWGNAVNQEFEHNPLSESELSAASQLNVDFSLGIGIEKLYGTTLIAGLQTDSYLLLLQQGDGRCDVFDENGRVTQPIPWDDRCVGTGTTSVCDNDAIQSTRFHVIDLTKCPVLACIAGSDGVEDSFPMSMERVHAYYRDLIMYCCEEGVEKLEQYLETELNELSRNGSADDVTVSGIIDIERCKPFLIRFKEENDLVFISEDIKAINTRITSIENGGRFTHFRTIYETSKANYDRIMEQYRITCAEAQAVKEVIEAQEKYTGSSFDLVLRDIIAKYLLPTNSIAVLKADLREKNDKICELRKSIDEAEKQLTKAESDFAPLRKKHKQLLQLREEKESELAIREKKIEQEFSQRDDIIDYDDIDHSGHLSQELL